MKKIVGFIALLTMAIGCKDIEKNPSGCDYGYVTNNSGECLSNSYSLGLKIQSANKNLYNRQFIRSYITDRPENGVTNWVASEIVNSLNSEDIISTYVEFVLTREKLSEVAAAHYSDMESLYTSNYSEEIYEAYNKAYRHNNLLSQSAISSARLFDRSIGDYDLNELIELTNKKQTLLNDLNTYASEKVLTATDNNRDVAIEIPYYYSTKGKSILEETRKAISLDENCIDREAECIQTLKEDVQENLNSLYQNLYRNL